MIKNPQILMTMNKVMFTLMVLLLSLTIQQRMMTSIYIRVFILVSFGGYLKIPCGNSKFLSRFYPETTKSSLMNTVCTKDKHIIEKKNFRLSFHCTFLYPFITSPVDKKAWFPSECVKLVYLNAAPLTHGVKS